MSQTQGIFGDIRYVKSALIGWAPVPRINPVSSYNSLQWQCNTFKFQQQMADFEVLSGDHGQLCWDYIAVFCTWSLRYLTMNTRCKIFLKRLSNSSTFKKKYCFEITKFFMIGDLWKCFLEVLNTAENLKAQSHFFLIIISSVRPDIQILSTRYP